MVWGHCATLAGSGTVGALTVVGTVTPGNGGVDGQQFEVSYFGDTTANTFTGGNDVVLMAIPEPRTALLGALGVLALLRRRRAS